MFCVRLTNYLQWILLRNYQHLLYKFSQICVGAWYFFYNCIGHAEITTVYFFFFPYLVMKEIEETGFVIKNIIWHDHWSANCEPLYFKHAWVVWVHVPHSLFNIYLDSIGDSQRQLHQTAIVNLLKHGSLSRQIRCWMTVEIHNAHFAVTM